MTLKTIAKCAKIHKKSQSPAFKDLQVGDQIGKTLVCFDFEERHQNYENIIEIIEAKEPEVFYAGGRWDLYKDGFVDAKREISDLLKKIFE